MFLLKFFAALSFVCMIVTFKALAIPVVIALCIQAIIALRPSLDDDSRNMAVKLLCLTPCLSLLAMYFTF